MAGSMIVYSYTCPFNGYKVDALNWWMAEREMGCKDCGNRCHPKCSDSRGE